MPAKLPELIDFVWDARNREELKAERERQDAFVFSNDRPMVNGRVYRLLEDDKGNILGWEDITGDYKAQYYSTGDA